MRSVVLVGFMGVGKTAVGKMLAQRLDVKFIDLDTLIEERLGMTISEMFDRFGEPYFRGVEKEAIVDLPKGEDSIVAAGGGAVLDRENVVNLRQIGPLIHLSARPEVIAERIKGQYHRPLFEAAQREEQVKRLLEERRPYYAQADYEIDTSDLTVAEVAERIESYLQES